MSKTTIIGILGAVTVIVCAFLPWISVNLEGKELIVTGLDGTGTRFGEPGKLSIGVAVVVILMMLIRRNWASRVNLFTGGFLAAWSFRNLLIYSRCEMGICPEREPALFIALAGAVIAFGCVLAGRNR
ncbi:hypothetical protein ACWKWU_12985 [Chitinophaga lutea]